MNKLEDSIGAPRGSVNKWEKGSIPGGNYLISLSNFFHVSTDWILKGEEEYREETTEEKHTKDSLFFNDNWEVVSQFEKLDEQDRAFIKRYIELAMFQKEQTTKNNPSNVTTPFKREQSEQAASKELTPDSAASSTIPILGRAAAGVPIEMVRFIEGYLHVPGKYKNCFAVKVDGESMINAGIENGGYVVVRQQPSVDNNDIALVKVDDGVTIKRFKLQNDLAYLISENDSMKDMVYDPKVKDMQILGLVVDIISPKDAAELVINEL